MNANLGWGLNARNNKRKKVLTGFAGGGDESSDDNDGAPDGTTTARSAVNREIAAEQAALRQRAQAAMMAASSDNSNVYDYDAEYESFSSDKKKQRQREADAAAASAATKDAKPRYITNLLKTAQRRNQEQEVIYERKLAKEQQEEDANLQYEGKEKFITSSYRQKLAEREQWAKEEADRTKREEEEERRNAANNKLGVGNFMFGSIGRNLLMKSGDGSCRNDDGTRVEVGRHDGNTEVGHDYTHNKSNYQGQESKRESERRWDASSRNRYAQADGSSNRNISPTTLSAAGRGNDIHAINTSATDAGNSQTGESVARSRQQILEERAIKIRAARERYFKRRDAAGLATQ